jgi:hypothetical protein
MQITMKGLFIFCLISYLSCTICVSIHKGVNAMSKEEIIRLTSLSSKAG